MFLIVLNALSVNWRQNVNIAAAQSLATDWKMTESFIAVHIALFLKEKRNYQTECEVY